jgi:hypothetical protein
MDDRYPQCRKRTGDSRSGIREDWRDVRSKVVT